MNRSLPGILGISFVVAVLASPSPGFAQVIERPVEGDSAAPPPAALIYQGSRKMRDLGEGRLVVVPVSFEDSSARPVSILPALDSPALRLAIAARSQENGGSVQIPPPVFPPDPVVPNESGVGELDAPVVAPPLLPVLRIHPLRWREPWYVWPYAPVFGPSGYYPPAWIACHDRFRRSWRSDLDRYW